MPKNPKQTSPKIAKLAGKTLSKAKNKTEASLAGTALGQAPLKTKPKKKKP